MGLDFSNEKIHHTLHGRHIKKHSSHLPNDLILALFSADTPMNSSRQHISWFSLIFVMSSYILPSKDLREQKPEANMCSILSMQG